MDFKGEYLTGDEFADIPAAEAEIVLDGDQSHVGPGGMEQEFHNLNFGQMRALHPTSSNNQELLDHNVNEKGHIFATPIASVHRTTGVRTKTMVAGQLMDSSGGQLGGKTQLTVSAGGALKACVIPRALLNDEQQLRAVLGSNKRLYCIPRSQLVMNRTLPNQTPTSTANSMGRSIIVSSGSPASGKNSVSTVVVNSLLNPDSTKPLPSFLRKASSLVGGQTTTIRHLNSNTEQTGGTTLIRTNMPNTPGLISLTRGGSNHVKEEMQHHQGFMAHGSGSMVGSSMAPPSSLGEDDAADQQGSMSYKTSGLRKYARAVCDKVKEKVITSYGEVADELVEEYAAEHPMIPQEQMQYIQKNIRRRVYDALNVLMALNILCKERKEIRWRGLPTNLLQDCQELEQVKQQRLQELARKNREVEDLTLQLISLKNLVLRNRLAQNRHAHPAEEVVDLPFLVVLANRRAQIDCTVSNDRQEYHFQFDQAFELRDDMDTLKRMGLTLRLGERDCTEEEFNQCLELVPPSLRIYVQAMYEQRPAIVPNFERLHFERRQQQQQQRQQQSHRSGGFVGKTITVSNSSTPKQQALREMPMSRSVSRYPFEDDIHYLE